jgi:DNA-binding winged helix-turn-helix (wHTH) protein
MMEAEQPRQRRDIQLGEWLVQPHLNRISRAGKTVQLEPKLMDVLSFLAERAGQVVSKEEISDAVWTDQFVTESVITRAIAGLRRALEDDAQNPTYIETISKRGYRLIILLRSPPISPVVTAPVPAPDRSLPLHPYVVGQWVRGERFYGREAQITEIIGGNRNSLWLLGTRGIGKTSLLKQLEHITAASPELGYLPVFWDLQGAETSHDLHVDLGDALIDAEERLQALGIDLGEIDGDDLFATLGRLRRVLQSRSMRLLLLCDEVEELIQLNQKEPALLRKLRRAMQSREGIRSVLASSIRLWKLAEQDGDTYTSPFLHGFSPPLYVGALTDDEAEMLIRQAQLASSARPRFADDTVELIRQRCGNHPYLIQLVCRRYVELDDPEQAIEDVATTPTVGYFFTVDYEMLTSAERAILHTMAGQSPASSGAIRDRLDLDKATVNSSLHRLERLGYLGRDEESRLYLSSYIFSRWLQDRG